MHGMAVAKSAKARAAIEVRPAQIIAAANRASFDQPVGWSVPPAYSIALPTLSLNSLLSPCLEQVTSACGPTVVLTEILHVRSIAPANGSPFDRRHDRGSPQHTERSGVYAAGKKRRASPVTRASCRQAVQILLKEGHSLAILDPICPKCGCKMILALPPDGKGPVIQCPRCEPSDPLKSENVERWIRSSLRPPV
jgi:hypothetical protein